LLQTLKAPSLQKLYGNNNTSCHKIQEKFNPSLAKGNGKLLCSKCLRSSEYAFERKRVKRYTDEEGPTMSMTKIIVSRCPKDGHYSTTLSFDLVRNKQYNIDEIRLSLERESENYCLASLRTKSYWRSWYKKVWESVVVKICKYLGNRISKATVSSSLQSFLKSRAKEWLRYVLDLFYVNFNNLCIFLDVVCPTIVPKGEKLHKKDERRLKLALKKAKEPP